MYLQVAKLTMVNILLFAKYHLVSLLILVCFPRMMINLVHVFTKQMSDISCDKPCCDITVVATQVTKDSVWETLRSPDPMIQLSTMHV